MMFPSGFVLVVIKQKASLAIDELVRCTRKQWEGGGRVDTVERIADRGNNFTVATRLL